MWAIFVFATSFDTVTDGVSTFILLLYWSFLKNLFDKYKESTYISAVGTYELQFVNEDGKKVLLYS
jgi:hypothetical protein